MLAQTRTSQRRNAIQPLRRSPGSGGLGGKLLGLTELGDRDSQDNQIRGERDGDQRGLASDHAGHRQQPGSGA
jgi:hypothetical protein